MTKEEHDALIEQIRTATQNNPEIGNTLLSLQNDYAGVLAERDTAITDRDTVIKERDSYAKLNNELWLNRNVNKPNEPQNNLGVESNEPPKKLSFDDLNFD